MARPPQSTELPGDHPAGTSANTASHSSCFARTADFSSSSALKPPTADLIGNFQLFISWRAMSRRKQLKPQPVKDDVLQASQNDADENKIVAKKRKVLHDYVPVKTEPCDDDVKSVASNHELKLACQFCGALFESISDLQTHTLRDHLPMPSSFCRVPTLLYWHCKNSQEKFRRTKAKRDPIDSSEWYRTANEYSLKPVPSLECQHCCAVLPSFAAFVLHMRGHLSDRDDSRCPRCPLSFNDAQARLAHVISHFEVRKPLRFCAECGVSFGDGVSLGQHFTEQHLKLQHLCTVCGQNCETQKEFL
ncbi:zinc finger, C2H2 type, partial [Ancylostoma duodenale]